MELEEINALTVEDVIEILIERLVDFSGVINEIYYVFADTELSKYDNLILNSRFIKPPLADFESELLGYQEELRFELAKRELGEAVAETKRLEAEAFKNRVEAIPGLDDVIRKNGYTHPNAALEVKRILDEQDYDAIEELEALLPSILEERQSAIDEHQLILAGREYRQVCQDVLDLVTGYNRYIARPGEEVDTLQGKYAAVEKALKDNRPVTAKNLIDAAPDDEFLTETVRLKLDRIFNRLL